MPYVQQVILVGLGGFIGSALRFMVSGWTQRLAPFSDFPYGTLAVNVIGCLLIGLLGGLAEYRQMFDPGQRLLLVIGVLGGFTTFSTFSFETLLLTQDGQLLKAAANIVAQVLFGMMAALAGYIAARMI